MNTTTEDRQSKVAYGRRYKSHANFVRFPDKNLCAWLFVFCVICRDTSAEPRDPSGFFTSIAAGTVVGAERAGGWSDIVMVSKPMVATGDVENVSDMVKDYAALFSTVILAHVDPTSNPPSLSRIGMGMARQHAGKLVIVSTSNTKGGVQLGIIESQVLKGIEQSVSQFQLVSRTDRAAILDCPAIVAVSGKHVDIIVRHLVWVSADRKVRSAVWFIRDDGSTRSVVNQSAKILPNNLRETRRLHVLKSEFTFGIPNSRAFAVDRLPEGKTLRFDKPEMELASGKSISRDSINQLVTLAQTR